MPVSVATGKGEKRKETMTRVRARNQDVYSKCIGTSVLHQLVKILSRIQRLIIRDRSSLREVMKKTKSKKNKTTTRGRALSNHPTEAG